LHGTEPLQAIADPAVGAVVVAYPTQEHARLVLAAFAAGKDVICEKPLAWTAAEGRAVQEAARVSGQRLAVCHIRRYWEPCRRLKEIAGTLGQLRQASWSYRVRQTWPADWRTAPPGGYLLDAHVHDMDMLLWLLGGPPRTVYAWGQNSADRGGTVMVTCQGGGLARFDWDGQMAGQDYPAGSEHHAEALGERGWARLAIVAQLVTVTHFVDGMDAPAREEFTIGEVIGASWPAMWGDFARYLQGGAPPATRPADAASAVEMVLGAVHSMETGAVVPLPLHDTAQ
jgi:predicted dehydrogenase